MGKQKYTRRQFAGLLGGSFAIRPLARGISNNTPGSPDPASVKDDHEQGNSADDLLVEDLRCEYLVNPLGIDETQPRFNWILRAGRRGVQQSGYQIMVASSPGLLEKNKGDLWDSGEIKSNDSIQIVYEGVPLQSRMWCFWKVRIRDEKGSETAWSKMQFFSMGLLSSKDWHSFWIGVEEPALLTDPNRLATPRYMRKSFTARNSIRKATVYATALGLYELRLNGKKVGDHLLAPEWTAYFKRIQYQTYDVTGMMQNGENTIAATLGNGWYCGLWQYWPPKVHIYGNQPYLKMQLEIEFDNGEKQMVVSDGTWKGSVNGPLRFAGIYEGETYDARLEMPGWDQNQFDDSHWSAVTTGETLPVGRLVAQKGQPIRFTQDIAAVKKTEPKPSVYVYDLGQNIAGWCRFAFKGHAGSTVTLKLNEMLNPDGTVYMDNLHAGNFGSGDDRQVIRYTFKGDGEETFEPKFSYQGFRYIQVEGLTEDPASDAITGRVFHTDCPQTGSFTCSDNMVNRLAENIQWSQRANFMGIPTDCPQRDERCGYTGDGQFFAPTAIYNMDIAAFFSKWLNDVCEDSQAPEGHFYDHGPFYGPGAAPNVGWSDAGIICPYIIYRTYGDTRIIRTHYAAMKKNIKWQILTSHNDTRGPELVGNGDWLNLGGGASGEVIATAYFGYNCSLMAEMAEAIGEHADSAAYRSRAAKIKSAFAREFIQENGAIKNSSQTGFALAYTMDMIPAEKKSAAATQFIKEIARFDNHLATGFIGTPRLLPALHTAGHDALAYQLLLTKTLPSWLYPVSMGATTIWERWDGYTKEKGFEDSSMNSFNHYSFGSVGQYLFEQIAGIRTETPGYRNIIIDPVIEDGLTWVKAAYRSIHGMIISEWKKENENTVMTVGIPANTFATVVIPAKNRDSITESGKPVLNNKEIRLISTESGKTVCQIGSGDYVFRFSR